jgi:hypothetical protein
VDDMIITGDDSKYIAFVKAHLNDQFLMFDLGPLKYFLGIGSPPRLMGSFISREVYSESSRSSFFY